MKEKFKAMSDIGCSEFASLLVKRVIYENSNQQEVIQRYNKTHEANIFNEIRLILYLDIIKDSIALTLDRSNDVVSLSQLVGMLDNEDLVSSLREDHLTPRSLNWVGSEIPDEAKYEIEARIQVKEREQSEKAFQDNYILITESWPEISASDLSSKLKNVRNKVLSHKVYKKDQDTYRLRKLSDFDLKWGECEEFLDQVEPIFEAIGILSLNTNYGYRSVRETYGKTSSLYWDTCRGPK